MFRSSISFRIRLLLRWVFLCWVSGSVVGVLVWCMLFGIVVASLMLSRCPLSILLLSTIIRLSLSICIFCVQFLCLKLLSFSLQALQLVKFRLIGSIVQCRIVAILFFIEEILPIEFVLSLFRVIVQCLTCRVGVCI